MLKPAAINGGVAAAFAERRMLGARMLELPAAPLEVVEYQLAAWVAELDERLAKLSARTRRWRA